MRFCGENTREIEASARHRLWARAFHPKARSHTPITPPSATDAMNRTTPMPSSKTAVTVTAITTPP